jgi:hypothetical protein
MVIPLYRIQEIAGSNLGPDVGYFELRGFLDIKKNSEMRR